MRFILFLILMGCSQHSGSRLITGDSRAGGAKPPNCSTPSPLCPDITDEEESENEGDDEKDGEESDKQLAQGSAGSSQSQMPPAPIDYLSGNFKLNVSRASIPNNKETELTLTVSATINLRLRARTQNGQLTHDLSIVAQKASSASKLPDTYKLDSTSTNKYFLGSERPRCNIHYRPGVASTVSRCILKVKQMDKNDSFTVTLKVKASEDFNIGSAKKCVDKECKEREPLTIKVN